MHITIKNKFLFFKDYKIKCAVGKRGIGEKKQEGDLITPKGNYKIKCIFFRPDKVKNLSTKLKKRTINKKMGWCDDPKSKDYNKLVRLPFKFNYEKLYRSDSIYDIFFVLDFNTNPIKKNKGSAIFIHIAKKSFSSTKGCVAIKKSDIKILAKKISKNTLVKII
tara:strand:+ start:131 stop:622 length:492 start_codon:yes stop_codon:yes gene_type:complete